MKVICAWCSKEMKIDSAEDKKISHGMCKQCSYNITGAGGINIHQFIESLGVPVIVFDGNTCVKFFNEQIASIIDQTDEILTHLCGDVFECENSFDKEKCGNTEKCSACKIRGSILETFNTGKSLVNIPATIQKKTKAGITQIEFTLTTAKVEDVVIMKVTPIK